MLHRFHLDTDMFIEISAFLYCLPRKITHRSSYSISVLLLLFPVFAIADESATIESVEAQTKAAEQELTELEQTVGEKADETAGDTQDNNTGDDESSSKPWLPAAKEFDWVQLTSGEWLKGEIKSMYNESLEFDSDKLDLLTIDWEDVKYLKSYRPSNVNIENHEPIVGSLQVSGENVTITIDDKAQQYSRTELISLTPYGDREIELWAVKFSLGIDVSRGNTEQFDYTARFNAKRRTARTRFELDYIGNVSETTNDDGGRIKTANNHRVNAAHNIYTTRHFFYQPLFAEYFRDRLQNIDRKITVGAGIGYTFLDTAKYEWRVKGGPAYLETRYVSVLPGEDQKADAAALALGTDFDAEINAKVDFSFRYNVQLAPSEVGGYSHHMITTVESEITDKLDLDVSLLWDRISNPTSDDSGVEPEPNDYRLTVGLTYTY